eukprot:5974408-Amphidinium_carterae.1
MTAGPCRISSSVRASANTAALPVSEQKKRTPCFSITNELSSAQRVISLLARIQFSSVQGSRHPNEEGDPCQYAYHDSLDLPPCYTNSNTQ